MNSSIEYISTGPVSNFASKLLAISELESSLAVTRTGLSGSKIKSSEVQFANKINLC